MHVFALYAHARDDKTRLDPEAAAHVRQQATEAATSAPAKATAGSESEFEDEEGSDVGGESSEWDEGDPPVRFEAQTPTQLPLAHPAHAHHIRPGKTRAGLPCPTPPSRLLLPLRVWAASSGPSQIALANGISARPRQAQRR